MLQGVFILGLNVAGPVDKTLIPHRGCGTCPKNSPRFLGGGREEPKLVGEPEFLPMTYAAFRRR